MSDNTYQIIIGVIIGVLTGGISSYFIWYLIFHILVPRLDFSQHISKTFETANHPIYRVKFENSGKRRAIDLQVNIRYRVKGLYPNNLHRWKVVYIPYSQDRREQIPFLSPVNKNQNAMRETIPFYLLDAAFNQDVFPQHIRDRHSQRTLTLEDLFEIGTEQRLQVNVFCYDEFSGTRKLFSSKVYTINDIRNGLFERDSLKIAGT